MEETIPAFPCGWPAVEVLQQPEGKTVRWGTADMQPDEALAIGHALMQAGREASK